MLNIVLYEPEIAPNTGNIIRLCANLNAQLHLIEPLGFLPDEKKLRRAGLDYADWDNIKLHADFDSFVACHTKHRIFTLSTHNKTRYTQAQFEANDAIVFGPETRGLPPKVRDSVAVNNRLTLPMAPNNRSLNLSNAVAIVAYEAWRQIDFLGAK